MNFENWILIIYKPKNQHQKEKKKEKKRFRFVSFHNGNSSSDQIEAIPNQCNGADSNGGGVFFHYTRHCTATPLRNAAYKRQSRFFAFEFGWAAALSGQFAGESKFESAEAGAGGGRVCEFELAADLLRGNRRSQMELRGWKRRAFWNLQEELHSRPHFALSASSSWGQLAQFSLCFESAFLQIMLFGRIQLAQLLSFWFWI